MIDHRGIEWLTIAEASQRWGIPPNTIRSWRRRGKIQGHRTIDATWVRADDITHAEHTTRGAYLAQRKQMH